ncbi:MULTISPECIES: ADP-ribosylglycohydrolase family protein [unclassified Paenibacillus]|uniref:ADP-ribosylglycohydrolase family protein n=1 Tax=unclassified Paenibacillus TaxID=185978 RepID=UPI0024069558|nr:MULTISPECIES: ADP-ribosylglycohydrolase family protein [unclassified Paenibacillus]MDF9842495.1 ADP-ribosyl-[dinitrogen reductase] hydrolase [Paenibacillus sp. PastF-2]MDF9849085.1 ADP-ribosyl-[dinitrogen reductase] hydrolase [Paenibacillus sp. PastM-2]MDF9855655.1 ADP-ribosyl-[dinitrogen reductase] hydrolase [Paenibacillus sp. PastF-1]MDH6480927.1 ADP-ribosyl-[dinitrogen reductase] hydrolase [Paenibacillus sp. PastH-2]MDH6508349.1 ADP-ribosyl-[dinitrogen reductase] hydrolase [Paenibacillus
MALNKDRYRGCLHGLAAGDALGTTVEFKAPGTFAPMDDIIGGGVFGLQPGEWTDDTSMALCLAESLLVQQGFDPADQMQRYLKWFREGYLSSTGECFDIGNATQAALLRYESGGEPYSGSADPLAAGNGSIMRLAPVAMYYAANPAEAIRYAALSSRTTHGAAECLSACRLMAAYILAGLHGWSKEDMLAPEAFTGWLKDDELTPHILDIKQGSYKHKEPPEIQGSGYVVESLEAGLWAFHHSESFAEGALLAVNLGNDADTTGAVYGQIAGAYYGLSGIPEGWVSKLAMRSLIDDYSLRLLNTKKDLRGN